jgi:PAS domain-containing protein
MTDDLRTPEIAPFAQRLLDASPDALLTITEDGQVVSWNRGAESMFGYTPETVRRRKDGVLIPVQVVLHRAEDER